MEVTTIVLVTLVFLLFYYGSRKPARYPPGDVTKMLGHHERRRRGNEGRERVFGVVEERLDNLFDIDTLACFQ